MKWAIAITVVSLLALLIAGLFFGRQSLLGAWHARQYVSTARAMAGAGSSGERDRLLEELDSHLADGLLAETDREARQADHKRNASAELKPEGHA